MGSERDDLRAFGFAPGDYLGTCRTCSMEFIGAKRCWTCEPCAIKANWEWLGLTPIQQAARVARNQSRYADHVYGAAMIAGMSACGRAALPQEDGG